MSLEVTVAVPFRQHGRDRLGEGEFVVALSLDRDWFSPDQAKRLVDIAAGRGVVERVDGDLVASFDPTDVEVPEGFVPDESVLHEQSTFERLLDAVVAAGEDKQTAVAGINRRQRDLAVTIETAALLYARERAVDVGDAAARVRTDLADAGADAACDGSDESHESHESHETDGDRNGKV